VSGLDHPALNVYLVDLREDRRLRSNERIRTFTDLGAVDRPAPRRMTCHYLISAWHPAAPTAQFDPTPEEHRLLYRASALLMNADPFVSQEIFAPDPLPLGFPDELAKAELPTSVLPVDGFPKYAEFWGTMGQVHPWKPAVYLTVTLPVLLSDRFAGPMVTTRITEYRRAGQPETAEVWIQIGGQVRTAGGEELPGAWVGIETPTGDPLVQTRTDHRGRFGFDRLGAGGYRLRARAAGHADILREIEVPSAGGEYDLIIT
jgi:hypothetical protein